MGRQLCRQLQGQGHRIEDPIAQVPAVPRLPRGHEHPYPILRQRVGKLHEPQGLERREVGVDSGHNLVDKGGDTGQDGRRLQLGQDDIHKLLLPLDAADVPQGVVPETHVLQGGLAVQMLLSLGDVDEELARVVRVLQALLHVDIDPADQVDDAGKALVVDDDEVIDRHSREVHHGVLQEVDTPVDIGVIDLAPSAPGDLHPRVPGDGGHTHRLVFRVEDRQGDRVGTRTAVDIIEPHDKDIHRAVDGVDIGPLLLDPIRPYILAPHSHNLLQVERVLRKEDLLQTKNGAPGHCQEEQKDNPRNFQEFHRRDTSLFLSDPAFL